MPHLTDGRYVHMIGLRIDLIAQSSHRLPPLPRCIAVRAAQFRDFKVLPLDDSHIYWKSFVLSPSWSDATLAQMPPSGWPAAVALDGQGQLLHPVNNSSQAVKQALVGQAPVASQNLAHHCRQPGYPFAATDCRYWGEAGATYSGTYSYTDILMNDELMWSTVLASSCNNYIAGGSCYVGGEQ